MQSTSDMDVRLVEIAAITVPARRRQARDIEALAARVAELGTLLHPITLTEDLTLVAGHRRLLACRQLGRERIPAHILAPGGVNAQLVEIDENLQRDEL